MKYLTRREILQLVELCGSDDNPMVRFLAYQKHPKGGKSISGSAQIIGVLPSGEMRILGSSEDYDLKYFNVVDVVDMNILEVFAGIEEARYCLADLIFTARDTKGYIGVTIERDDLKQMQKKLRISDSY